MTTVDYIFDFASPNAYLAHKVLPAISERTGATFNYIPCLLGGVFKASGNQSPIVTNAKVPSKLAYEALEIRRFIQKHELTAYSHNPHFPVNTLMMMRAALIAEEAGRLMEYVEAGFYHMWEAPKKMDDPEVAAAAFTESGFDGEALIVGTKNPEVKAKLIENTSQAVKRGVFGMPTFFVGDEMFFGKDKLYLVEEEVLKIS